MRNRLTGEAFGAAILAVALAAAPAQAAAPHLTLTTSYAPIPATVGADAVITLTVTNDGDAATGVTLLQQYPDKLHYKQDDGAGLCAYTPAGLPDTARLTCTIGNMAAAATKTFHVTVVPQSAGSATAGASVASNELATSTSDTMVQINPAPKASPTISATVSGDAQAYDPQTFTATLAGGSHPAGDIIFSVFSPADTTCAGSPVYAQMAPVSDTGTYPSPQAFTTGSGGTYHWTASYGGDGANNTASTACTALDIKAFPNIMLVTGVSSSTATLTNSLDATGTLTFNAYADAACATPVASAAVPVNGDGSYTGAYTLPAPGNYVVTVTYSGDARNAPSTPSGCTGGGVVTIEPAGATPPPSTPPPPPPNHFSSPKTKASSTGALTLSLAAPAAGRFTVTAKYGRTTYGKISVSKHGKGSVKLTLKPSAAGKKLLKKHARLKLKVTVTFTPTGGKAYTRTLTVTIKR